MRTWIALVAAVMLMGVALTVALAQAATAPTESQSSAPGAAAPAAPAEQAQEVVGGGMVILRLRATVAGMSAAARAGILYERLNDIVSDRQVKLADIKAVRKGNDWLVMAGPHLFVTVTEQEAKINRTTPMSLAEVWASNLRMAMPLARPVPVTP
jgi:hypothetical protein